MGLAKDAAGVAGDVPPIGGGRIKGFGQGVKTAGGAVGRLVAVAVEQVHDAAEHAPYLRKWVGVLGTAGDNGGVAEGGGDGQFGGVAKP